MSTRIVFDNGLNVIVAQDEGDVVDGLTRDHPNPVTLSGRGGRPLHINWDHVVFVEATSTASRPSPRCVSSAG